MTDSVSELIKDSLSLPQDSHRDKQIVQALRRTEPSEALEVIKEMVIKGCPNSYYVACKVLNDRKVAEPFFVFGLSRADASSIKDWIEFAEPRIGLKKVVKHLRQYGIKDPQIMDWAQYWFPRILSAEEGGSIE